MAGADGCRGRWVVVAAAWSDGDDPAAIEPSLSAELADDLRATVERVRAGEVAALAVDMPIGLFDDRPRPCDVAARVELGPRRSTVFPAPVRATLAATDYRHACELSRAACDKALSKQAFNLLGAIRHLDELLAPSDADTIVEAHPELAFARLAGEPVISKHAPEGRQRRRDLLAARLGRSFERLLDGRGRIPVVDLLDATALSITARRVAEGTARRLGGELDSTGKPAQVWF